MELPSGLIIASRQAWRLNNLDGHVEQVTLNGIPLSEAGLPANLISAAGGTGDALPRGFLLVRTVESATSTVTLSDPVRGWDLAHQVHFENMEVDRWGDGRPRPRYSVGPTQKDVPHYI